MSSLVRPKTLSTASPCQTLREPVKDYVNRQINYSAYSWLVVDPCVCAMYLTRASDAVGLGVILESF